MSERGTSERKATQHCKSYEKANFLANGKGLEGKRAGYPKGQQSRNEEAMKRGYAD